MPRAFKNRSRQYLRAHNLHHVLFLNKFMPPEINDFSPYCLSNRPKIPKTSGKVRINLGRWIENALFGSQFNKLLISWINPFFFHASRLNHKYLKVVQTTPQKSMIFDV